ncbi:MAG: LPS export ABC transporter periplasmic protein LptC [Rhodospirillaceae bacterium]|nr:LPS export ABC transporter periplasmic protein LptC [Rhodospirillaceae bacterium]
MSHDDTMTAVRQGNDLRGRHVRPRQHRARVDWRYTRFVGLMRWLLPASALILATTVVVWPSFNVTNTNNMLDLQTLNLPAQDRPTMANARFLGTDKDGQPYTVTAATAWQEQGHDELIYLEELQGDMTMESGLWATISSDRGIYDQVSQMLVVESNVSVYTDEGYELHSDYALIDLDQGIAEGHLPVSGQGPAGLIDAQGFRVTENGDRLYFDGRVYLTLFPESQP